jgi:hypothetical protein
MKSEPSPQPAIDEGSFSMPTAKKLKDTIDTSKRRDRLFGIVRDIMDLMAVNKVIGEFVGEIRGVVLGFR